MSQEAEQELQCVTSVEELPVGEVEIALLTPSCQNEETPSVESVRDVPDKDNDGKCLLFNSSQHTLRVCIRHSPSSHLKKLDVGAGAGQAQVGFELIRDPPDSAVRQAFFIEAGENWSVTVPFFGQRYLTAAFAVSGTNNNRLQVINYKLHRNHTMMFYDSGNADGFLDIVQGWYVSHM